MEGPGFEDRRLFMRFPLSLPLGYLIVKLKKRCFAFIKDVSANGIGITVHEDLFPYTPLEVRFNIPHSTKPLRTKGRVIWTKEVATHTYRVGIKLQKPDLMGVARLLHAQENPQTSPPGLLEKIKNCLWCLWF